MRNRSILIQLSSVCVASFGDENKRHGDYVSTSTRGYTLEDVTISKENLGIENEIQLLWAKEITFEPQIKLKIKFSYRRCFVAGIQWTLF